MPNRIIRYAEYVVLVAFSAFLVVRGVQPGWHEVHSDFANYYVSASLVADGVPLDKIYDNDWFQEQILKHGITTPGKFSPFPPITSLIMIPLTGFTPLNAQRIFICINLLFLGAGIMAFKKLTGWSALHSTLLILGSGISLVNNFAFGQVYWVMTVCILLSIIWFEKDRLLIAGATLSIFAAIKYFPIVFSGGLLLSGLFSPGVRKNKDLLMAIYSFGMLLLLFVAQYLFFGGTLVEEFIRSSFLPHLDSNLSGQSPYSFYFQSWDSLLRNLFVYDPEYNTRPFINWSRGRVIIKSLVALLVFSSLLVTLYRYRTFQDQSRRAVFLSLPAIAAMVLLPASASYHYILLLIPLALIVRENLLSRQFLLVTLTLYVLIGFIPYGKAFFLAEKWGVVFAYPRLWLMTSLYFFVLKGLTRQARLLFPA